MSANECSMYDYCGEIEVELGEGYGWGDIYPLRFTLPGHAHRGAHKQARGEWIHLRDWWSGWPK